MNYDLPDVRPRRSRRSGAHRPAVAPGAAQRDQRRAAPRADARVPATQCRPRRARRGRSPARDARSRRAATSICSTAWSNDRALRRDVIAEGRELVLNMIRCRVPVVAAVNGPAVGLGCSVIALSDVVYMAESAYLSDPHVTVGLVAADGGPLTWPLHTSLLLAKEYAFTGDRITATRAAEIGLANHVCPDGEVLVGRARGRAQDRRAAASGRRSDEARAEPARRAGGARHHRLRDGGRDRVVRHARPARERRPFPRAYLSGESDVGRQSSMSVGT